MWHPAAKDNPKNHSKPLDFNHSRCSRWLSRTLGYREAFTIVPLHQPQRGTSASKTIHISSFAVYVVHQAIPSSKHRVDQFRLSKLVEIGKFYVPARVTLKDATNRLITVEKFGRGETVIRTADDLNAVMQRYDLAG